MNSYFRGGNFAPGNGHHNQKLLCNGFASGTPHKGHPVPSGAFTWILGP